MPFELLKNLYSILDKKHKSYILIIFFIFLLQMILELFSIALFIPLISLILNSDILENNFYIFFKDKLNLDLYFLLGDIKTFLIFFLLVFIIKSLLITFCNWEKFRFTYVIRKYLTDRIYQKYLDLPFEEFIGNNSSEYLKTINTEISIASNGFLNLLEFLSEIIIITGIAIFLFFYNFEATLIVAFLIAATLYLIDFFTKKKIIDLGDKLRILDQQRLQNFIESFNLIKEIKIFGNQTFFKERDQKFTSEFLQNDLIFRFLKSLPRVLLELLLIFILFVLIIINLNHGDTTYILATLGVFAASAFRLMPSTVRVVTTLQFAKYASPSINNVVKQIKESLYKKNEFKDKKKIELKEFKKNISFSGVYFKYKKTNDYILKDVSFDIRSNKIIGLKGKTGSGKTTIVSLIAGLITPSKGSISIDEISFTDLNIHSLHKLLSYVPQNIYLLDASIKDNILFGSNLYSEKDLKEVIKKANLEDFVKGLPKGIETIIGERNSKISGGQAQRIGIARALIKKPSILIFDESTNSLDSETELQIMNSILKLKNELTIIMISHSDKSLNICDEIIDINDFKKERK